MNGMSRKIAIAGVLVVLLITAPGSVAADQDVLQELGTRMDLECAIAYALRNNPSLAAAASRVNQARQLVLQARAAYYPSLDATVSAARVGISETDRKSQLQTARLFSPTATVDDTQETYATGLTAVWTLFDGFERKFNHAAADYGKQISIQSQLDTRRLLIGAISQAYYAAQLGWQNIAIARADQAFNLRQYKDAKARYRAGSGSFSDMLNFEVRVNSAKAERIRAEETYDTALIGLAALMGLPNAAFPSGIDLAPLASETSVQLGTVALEEHLQTAAQLRPDLTQAEIAVKQAEARTKTARAAFFPKISLSATLDGDRSGNSGFESDDFGDTIALNLSFNLFAGGLHRARVNEARARTRESSWQLDQSQLTVRSEVREATTRVTSAQQQLVLQQSNADLVRQNRDLVEKEYQAGQGSLVRLNEAQRDLTTAQSRLALARVSLQQAWAELETATGEILARYRNEENLVAGG